MSCELSCEHLEQLGVSRLVPEAALLGTRRSGHHRWMRCELQL